MKAKGSVSNKLSTIIADPVQLRCCALENGICSSEVANQHGVD